MLKINRFLFILICLNIGVAIDCYQCSGTDSSGKHLFQCNKWLENDNNLVAESCEGVYGAKFCIKHSGRFEGSFSVCGD